MVDEHICGVRNRKYNTKTTSAVGSSGACNQSRWIRIRKPRYACSICDKDSVWNGLQLLRFRELHYVHACEWPATICQMAYKMIKVGSCLRWRNLRCANVRICCGGTPMCKVILEVSFSWHCKSVMVENCGGVKVSAPCFKVLVRWE